MEHPIDTRIFVDPQEKPTKEEIAYLNEKGIRAHFQRYRCLKLIRYLQEGNNGPGLTVDRRVEILLLAQEQWLDRKVIWHSRVATVEFLLPFKQALSKRISINPAIRSFEAWIKWADNGRRNTSACTLLSLKRVPTESGTDQHV